MRMSNYTPGFVVSYNASVRRARVSIPGVTDGSEVFPEADFCYPIGDKSEHTDIRVLPGDRVWLDFVNGDPRFPMIVGYRAKETDNAINVRRLHHANIELQADTNMALSATAGTMTATAGGDVLIESATTITLRAPNIVLDSPLTRATGELRVAGILRWLANMVGLGTAVVNGQVIDERHRHAGVQNGTGETTAVSGP